MTPNRKPAPTTKRELASAIAAAIRPLEARIARLEDEVFPQPGPSGLGTSLNHLAARVAELDRDLGTKLVGLDQKYDTKIAETIRIVAQLRDMVISLQAARSSRVMTIGGGG